jgi:hypothetical protein
MEKRLSRKAQATGKAAVRGLRSLSYQTPGWAGAMQTREGRVQWGVKWKSACLHRRGQRVGQWSSGLASSTLMLRILPLESASIQIIHVLVPTGLR